MIKPALLLTLCLGTILRAGEPLPGNPAPAQAAPAAVPAPPPPPVLKIAPVETASPAQQQVNAELPKYDPAAPKDDKTVNAPSPGALELPKITVRPKERPRLTPSVVVTNKGLEDKVSPLDGKLLNKFTLPGWMGGQTAAERAREEQRLAEKQALTKDVNTIARAVEVIDPAQAKALRDAVNRP